MDGTPEEPVGPVRQQIADVDQDWWARVAFRARRANRDRCPASVLCYNLQARLTPEPEQECDRTVVRVRASANVLAGVVDALERRIPQKAEDGPRSTFLCFVS